MFEPPSREPSSPFQLRDLVNTPGKKVAAVLLVLIAASLLACYGVNTYGPLADYQPEGTHSTP